jgi:N-acyl-D-aspartate/D-glutamate deacylase
MLRHKFQNFFLWPAFTLLVAFSQSAPGADYDVVISNGRVMNPASGLHIVHIGSSGGNRVPLLLDLIDRARANGIDVSTEVYPYTAWSTFIGASIFNGNFTEALGLDYSDIELPENGERLDEERFHRLREEAPGTIIVGHGMREENVTAAVAHPGVMIASDGMMYKDGRAHPRGAGTLSRVLGHYVREKQALSLIAALGKMSYLPARRLENVVPQMKNKGRISEGADADIVVFDPDRVTDRATFNDPAMPSEGIEHVLVNGVFVVRNGTYQENTYPGKPIRR